MKLIIIVIIIMMMLILGNEGISLNLASTLLWPLRFLLATVD